MDNAGGDQWKGHLGNVVQNGPGAVVKPNRIPDVVLWSVWKSAALWRKCLLVLVLVNGYASFFVMEWAGGAIFGTEPGEGSFYLRSGGCRTVVSEGVWLSLLAYCAATSFSGLLVWGLWVPRFVKAVVAARVKDAPGEIPGTSAKHRAKPWLMLTYGILAVIAVMITWEYIIFPLLAWLRM